MPVSVNLLVLPSLEINDIPKKRTKWCGLRNVEFLQKRFSKNVSDMQCDQIGQILKILGNEVPCKSSQNIFQQFWAIVKIALLR